MRIEGFYISVTEKLITWLLKTELWARKLFDKIALDISICVCTFVSCVVTRWVNNNILLQSDRIDGYLKCKCVVNFISRIISVFLSTVFLSRVAVVHRTIEAEDSVPVIICSDCNSDCPLVEFDVPVPSSQPSLRKQTHILSSMSWQLLRIGFCRSVHVVCMSKGYVRQIYLTESKYIVRSLTWHFVLFFF